jgi:2-methylfumaryl-CoA hydratase
VGVLRVRTFATRNRPANDFPERGGDGRYAPDVVLDLDYSVFVPARP